MLGLLLPQRATAASGGFTPFGRVMEKSVYLYDSPSYQSTTLRSFNMDEVISISGVEMGDKFPLYNQVWYQISDKGFIHSTQLQPVRIKFNEPDAGIPTHGILSEVTVPYTDARAKPLQNSEKAYRYYYATTHWIDKLVTDANNQKWYRVMDDRDESDKFYVPAEHLRVISAEEIAPLSPEVPLHEKTIEVHASEQLMIAFEGDAPVLIAPVSLGDKGKNPRWRTPLGEFQSFYKRPSRHMTAGNLAFGDYDLPGVPWVSYITNWGIAFHGTYWHNDFGRPRSHGCINLPPETAKWVYRWTQPEVPYDMQLIYQPGTGTKITIV